MVGGRIRTTCISNLRRVIDMETVIDRSKRIRINMRIPAHLVDFIKQFTESRGTTMTQDYVDYLKDKKTKVLNGTDSQRV